MKLSCCLVLPIEVVSEGGIGALRLNPGVERVEHTARLFETSELLFNEQRD